MADKKPATQQSKPFPGSLTPGWNDPPFLNSVTRSSGSTRLNLNKRVAFPLNSTSSSFAGNSSTVPTNLVQLELMPASPISKPPNLLGKPMGEIHSNQEFHSQITERPIDDTNSVNKHQNKNYQ